MDHARPDKAAELATGVPPQPILGAAERLMVCLDCCNGNTDHPLRLNPWFVQYREQWVRAILFGHAAVGARNFCLRLPYGTRGGTMLGGQMTRLEESDPALFWLIREAVRELRKHYPDVRVGVYDSAWLWVRGGIFKDSPKPPQFTSRTHRAMMLELFGGAARCELDYVVADEASAVQRARGEILSWAEFVEDTLGLELIGEAYPRRDDGSFDREALLRMGQWAKWTWVKQYGIPLLVNQAATGPEWSQRARTWWASPNFSPGWADSEPTARADNRRAIIDEIKAHGFSVAMQVGMDRGWQFQLDLEMTQHVLQPRKGAA